MPSTIQVIVKANGDVITDSHSEAGKCKDIAKQLTAALKGRMQAGEIVEHDHAFDKDEKVIANVANQ